jgi:hypothetical protein
MGRGGKESMEMMAKSSVEAMGLTQISEILSVPEVELVGPYPGNLQLMRRTPGSSSSGHRTRPQPRRFCSF